MLRVKTSPDSVSDFPTIKYSNFTRRHAPSFGLRIGFGMTTAPVDFRRMWRAHGLALAATAGSMKHITRVKRNE